MSEKLHPKSEKKLNSTEAKHSHEKQAADNHERLNRLAAEQKHKKQEQLEDARENIEKHALAKEEFTTPTAEEQPEPVYFTRADRERSFQATMHHVRSQLSKPQQVVSKIVHQKQVEQISEIASKTVARPSGIMGASSAALVGLVVILGFTKHVGFQLSGSEFWILLCLGYIVGVAIEYIRKIFSRKSQTE